MANSREEKSVEAEYESDADEVAALRWTARRREASDDDDDREEVKEKYRRSSIGVDEESDGLDGAPEYDDEHEGVVGEELEEVSQEEGEFQEVVPVKKGKEKKAMSEEVFVPRSWWFYTHDDRFRSHRSGRRRGTMIGMKLWDGTDEQK